LDFSFAAAVFADPLAAFVFDRHEDGEDRWHALGTVGAGLTLLVVWFTYPDPDSLDRIRVIGLRKATRDEQRRYHEPAE
jgi:uncharacterized protein